MFHCKNNCMHCIIAEKTIALVIKCGSARSGGYRHEVTRGGGGAPFCSLRPSIHVNGDIFKFDTKLWEIRVKGIFKMSSNAHCKVCLFIRMTPRVSFIQYPRLYSVLHMSQINVRLTSLRTGDVALCPDNLRPIKLTSSAYFDCLLLSLSK